MRIGATLLIAAGLLGFMLFIYRQKASPEGAFRREYEGLVVDKSETFVETRYGSAVRRRLLIQDKEGARFEVAVDEELYKRALKGMWIKKESGKRAELSWP